MPEYKIKTHNITLQDVPITLRPLTENDWGTLSKWNTDPEVLYFSEGDDVSSRDLATVQSIYRSVSQNAFCFMIEMDGASIGECWLQRMNLERILNKYPGLDCRRIDILIGEKLFWGKGIGSKVIRMLLKFGFERKKADAIFGCDVADFNPRSIKAFQKNGFEICSTITQPPGNKAKNCYDLILTMEKYRRRYPSG